MKQKNQLKVSHHHGRRLYHLILYISVRALLRNHSRLTDWLILCPSPLCSCFLSLLLVAAVVWKIKQTCWASRRREVGPIIILCIVVVFSRVFVCVQYMHTCVYSACCQAVCVYFTLLHTSCHREDWSKYTLTHPPHTHSREGWVNVTSPG